MTWHVQFTEPGGSTGIVRFPTPEHAIEEACRMLDDGCDVFGIGTGPLSDSIDRGHIKRIHEMWKKAHGDQPTAPW
jgi:hypothetical protein